MTKEKGNSVWWIMLVLSCLLIAFTIFAISSGDSVLKNGLKQFAGSSFDLANLDEAAYGFLTMAMMKPLWEEFWIGIIGIFVAIGLKRKMKYAWILGIVWGAMMLVNGIVQGGYEMFLLGWSGPCTQTYIFLVLGLVALVSLLVARKGFSVHAT